MCKKRLFAILLLITSQTTLAQQCDRQRMSTQLFDFIVSENGNVLNIETGLTWQRCAFGQQWNGDECIGEAKLFGWSEIQTLVLNFNKVSTSRNSWRLPRLNELATIVERGCVHPRIDLRLFPNTPAASFWSSDTLYKSEHAYAMDFDQKGVQIYSKTKLLHVRLVQGR